MTDTVASPLSNLPNQAVRGSIVRLELPLGFGYVCDANGDNRYIFLIGKAISHVNACKLSVGAKVTFKVQGQGVVSELSII